MIHRIEEPRRILLAMDNREDANWGSRATTNGLVKLVAETYPDAEIRGVRRECAKPHRVLRPFADQLAPMLQEAGEWTTRRAQIVMRSLTRLWREELEWADLILVNGEGTLHPQLQTDRWVPALSWAHDVLKLPIWIANCSLKFVGSVRQPMFEGLLRRAQHVAVREPISFRHVSDAGMSVTQAADCAFLTTPAEEREIEPILRKVGITGEFAILTGSSSVEGWDLEAQQNIIKLLQGEGLQVLYALSARPDMENYRRLDRSLPLITHRMIDERQLMSVQARARVLVGGRFHPMILAALAGTPFVALPGNTHKNLGLMEMLGMESQMAQFDDPSAQLRLLRNTLRDRDTISRSLRHNAERCMQAVSFNLPTRILAPA